MAAQHLLDVGCRRIATITGNFKINLSRDRYAGLVETLAKNGVQFDERLLWKGGFTYEAGIDGVNHFIEEGLEFDGLWGQNDMVAIAAISTLVKRGLRVPEDVAVIGMDDVRFSEVYNPSLSTIYQPFAEMSDIAVDYIDKLTSGETIAQNKVRLQPSLVVRNSTLKG